MPDSRLSLRARWILPVDGEPIENGTIEIEQGRITAIHAAHDPHAVDLGNAAILPGFVNAHTHLEFSNLTAPLEPAHPFTDWIRALVAERRRRGSGDSAEAEVRKAISRGLRECTQAGTTTVGEITTTDLPVYDGADDNLCVVAFREVIARLPEHSDAQIEVVRRHLERYRIATDRRAIAGLSPHAPYSVHPGLLRQLVDLACEFAAPVAMHVAETHDELELLRHGTGQFRKMLEEFGVWREGTMPTGMRPLDTLRELDRLPRALIIHGNYLDDEEIAFIASRPHLTVVYCPRTHHFFGHIDHPWRRMLEQGAGVALGTDSRASNPDLSLWNELRFLRRAFPDVPPRTLLQIGTLHGARALGLDAHTGSLATGKSADLTLVNLGADGASDPEKSLFTDDCSIAGTICRGVWLGATRTQ